MKYFSKVDSDTEGPFESFKDAVKDARDRADARTVRESRPVPYWVTRLEGLDTFSCLSGLTDPKDLRYVDDSGHRREDNGC